MITGNFNCPDIDWDTLSTLTSTSALLYNFVFDFKLVQLISIPTHIKGNILDLILPNYDDFMSNLIIHPHQVSIHSDHYMLSFSIRK